MRFLRFLFWLAVFLGSTMLFLVLIEHGFSDADSFAEGTRQELEELSSFLRSLLPTK
ncbi:MAG: hypothetical protein P8J87_15405 [Verrucomicrobiales bacterium]|nr:hypothetical protein [Verrucomicrobiales bacterium]